MTFVSTRLTLAFLPGQAACQQTPSIAGCRVLGNKVFVSFFSILNVSAYCHLESVVSGGTSSNLTEGSYHLCLAGFKIFFVLGQFD